MKVAQQVWRILAFLFLVVMVLGGLVAVCLMLLLLTLILGVGLELW